MPISLNMSNFLAFRISKNLDFFFQFLFISFIIVGIITNYFHILSLLNVLFLFVLYDFCSILVNFIFSKTKTRVRNLLQVFFLIFFIISLTMLNPIFGPYRNILIGFFVVNIFPFWAIFYLWITWMELQILEKANLEN